MIRRAADFREDGGDAIHNLDQSGGRLAGYHHSPHGNVRNILLPVENKDRTSSHTHPQPGRRD